jgi:hypothetical protein
VRVELVYFAGCPNVAPMRELLRRCLDNLELHSPIVEVNTDAPGVADAYRRMGSPTILVDGADVLGGEAASAESCRLQLPTEADLFAALEGRRER